MQVQMPSSEEARVPSKSRIAVVMGKEIPGRSLVHRLIERWCGLDFIIANIDQNEDTEPWHFYGACLCSTFVGNSTDNE